MDGDPKSGPIEIMELENIHIPVALDRALELLGPALEKPSPVLVDGTLGMGGHAEAFLDAFPTLTLIGIDRDPEARVIATKRLKRFEDRVQIFGTTYDQISNTLKQAGVQGADAILLDIGVSSLQLDTVRRGFSYTHDAELDMRMDIETTPTAGQIIAEYPLAKLAGIFERYGEEKLAMRYARAIIKAREQEEIRTSGQLVDILQAATPAALKNVGHPAKRVFQALRIEVNQELAVLEETIPAAIESLNEGGRILVMSYQSLEDRIVKSAFKRAAESTAPMGLPIELEEHKPVLKLLMRQAERASDSEIERNPRSKPLRLRAAEKIRKVTA